MEFKWLEWGVTGLAQGVPLVVIVGAYHFIRSSWRKENQKKYIREIISNHVEKIRDAKDKPQPGPKSEKIFKASEIRKSHYAFMYKQIIDLLSHKAVLINYEDEETIRGAFYYINTAYRAHIFESGLDPLPPLEIYEERFIERLKEVQWLELEKPEHPLPFMR